jgi:hypothetical protein
MAAGFSYQTMTAPDAIRLLLLQPRGTSAEDEIHCKLQHTTIAEYEEDLTVGYTALSYVWGSEEEQRMIFVDGSEFHVTVNLFCALRSIRHESKEFPLWVDAVCIDQQNIRERGQQVRFMGSIYASARNTIIYLGESDEQSDRAIRALNDTGGVSDFPGDFPNDESLKDCIVSSILSRPWFTRVWVLQELALSQNPIIQCGHSRVRWGRLPSFLFSSRGSSSAQHSGWSKKEQLLIDMQEAREKIQLGNINNRLVQQQQNLFALVLWRSGLGAKDPRDIIYAHIGMVNHISKDQVSFKTRGQPRARSQLEMEAQDGQKQIPHRSSPDPPMHGTTEIRGTVISKWLDQDITIDYGKPVAEVYNGFARVLIEKSQDLSFTAYIEATHPQARMPGLASWAPDWTLRIQDAGIDSHGVFMPSLRVSGQNTYSFNFDNSILGLLGSIITHIKEITEVIYPHDPSLPGIQDPEFFEATKNFSGISTENQIRSYREIYDRWRKRLGSEVLPALREQKLNDYREEDNPLAWDEKKIAAIAAALYNELSGGVTLKSVADYLVRFTRIQGDDKRVQGRRIALLEDGTSVFVPAYSKKGDAFGVINLYSGLAVLRRHDAPDDPSIVSSLKSKAKTLPQDTSAGKPRYGRQGFWRDVVGTSIDSLPVRHYTFVGACFGDESHLFSPEEEKWRWDHCIIELH